MRAGAAELWEPGCELPSVCINIHNHQLYFWSHIIVRYFITVIQKYILMAPYKTWHLIVRSHFQWRNQNFKNAKNASYMANKLLISLINIQRLKTHWTTANVCQFISQNFCLCSIRVKWRCQTSSTVNLLPNPLARFQHNRLRSPTKLACPHCPHCPQGRSGCNQRPVCSRRHHTQCNKLFNSCPWIAIRLYLAMLPISQEEVSFRLQSWSFCFILYN